MEGFRGVIRSHRTNCDKFVVISKNEVFAEMDYVIKLNATLSINMHDVSIFKFHFSIYDKDDHSNSVTKHVITKAIL